MLRFLAKAWRRWLRFAEIIGNIQMTILLSVIYWTAVLMVAVPFKVLADPLALRSSVSARWVLRTPASNLLDSMHKQG